MFALFAYCPAYRSRVPRPEFTDADYVDPNAPEGERRLRPDHPAVRDLSYDRSRMRQLLDLYKNAVYDPNFPDEETMQAAEESGTWPPRLEVYIKETPRGPGYVADFVYLSHDLPVTVYGVLINDGHGLAIGELELWRSSWGYYDRWDDFVGKDQWLAEREAEEDRPTSAPGRRRFTGITTTVLRQIPLGDILAEAQQCLAWRDWEDEGIRVLGGPDIPADELPPTTRSALETAADGAVASRSAGRPPLPDGLLAEVAHAYIEEAPRGRGLHRRLSTRFDRPESTVRDWISQARDRGFLTPAAPGRRGAGAGPRLSPPS